MKNEESTALSHPPTTPFPTMEELKWSGTGGSILVTPVVGIRCVHHIEETDYTAWFATGAV